MNAKQEAAAADLGREYEDEVYLIFENDLEIGVVVGTGCSFVSPPAFSIDRAGRVSTEDGDYVEGSEVIYSGYDREVDRLVAEIERAIA
jgi:hypothetical protein